MTKMNELYEKVAKDEALQAELTEIAENGNADSVEEILNEFVAFAKRQGYDVTAEEVSAFFGGMSQAFQELSDAELDAVAGGVGEVHTLPFKPSDNLAFMLSRIANPIADVCRNVNRIY